MAVVTAAFRFSSTITLGSIIVAALVSIAGLAVFAYGARWKAAWQVASTQAEELRKALKDEQGRGDRLEGRLAEALELNTEARVTIERLEALPNLERLVMLMSDTAERQDKNATERLKEGLEQIRVYVDRRFDAHETHAQERHDAQIRTLQEMSNLLRAVRQDQTHEGSV